MHVGRRGVGLVLFPLCFLVILTNSLCWGREGGSGSAEEKRLELTWQNTQDAATACPFHLPTSRIMQSSILNAPFRARAFDLYDGKPRWDIATPQDADLAVSPYSQTTSPIPTVLLEYDGEDRNNLVLRSTSANWRFAPDEASAVAQSNPVMLMAHNQSETWFCFTGEISAVTTCTFLETARGVQVRPNIQLAPQGFALWQQTGSLSQSSTGLAQKSAASTTAIPHENTAVFLVRSVKETRLIVLSANSGDKNSTLTLLDRLPHQTEVVCMSSDGEWIISGFHVLYVYRRDIATNRYVWFTTLLSQARNIHPAACRFSARGVAAVSWFLDQVRESQLFLYLYKMPFSPMTNTQAPTPFASWASSHDVGIWLPDKIVSIRIPVFDAASMHTVVIAGTQGSVALDGTTKNSGRVLVFEFRNPNQKMEIMESYDTMGSLLDAYVPDVCAGSQDIHCLVFCSKQCHSMQACAGGQLGVLLYKNETITTRK